MQRANDGSAIRVGKDITSLKNLASQNCENWGWENWKTIETRQKIKEREGKIIEAIKIGSAR